MLLGLQKETHTYTHCQPHMLYSI